MSPAGHDDVRAAAALLAIAACDWQAGQAIILGADPGADRAAGIACVLAAWLADVLRETGTEPKAFAKQAIAGSIADEATEGAEDPP